MTAYTLLLVPYFFPPEINTGIGNGLVVWVFVWPVPALGFMNMS